MAKQTGRRQLVGYLQGTFGIGQRRACQPVTINRKAVRYWPQRPGLDARLTPRVKQLVEQHPHYGYLMLHELLRWEDLMINRKGTYCVYSDLGLQVRTKRRKKLTWPQVPLELPRAANKRRSLDFVHDQLADGQRLKILNIFNDNCGCVSANWWMCRFPEVA